MRLRPEPAERAREKKTEEIFVLLKSKLRLWSNVLLPLPV